MVQKIALFNHKGGVSKTTTTFNLGWMLASKGKRVILVDTDPQCNLTGMVLGTDTEDDQSDLASFYDLPNNIKTALAPAFESQPRIIEAVDCIPVEGQAGLFLLPGHVGLAEYEVTLGIAQELSGSIQTLRNVPGSINFLLEKTAEQLQADYILIDMSPSLGSINQNLLMTSDFFLVPTAADFFSLMAINSLSTILPKWAAWAKRASALPTLREAAYPFPDTSPRFMGIIVQNYRVRKGRVTVAFEQWVTKIENQVSDQLVPVLDNNGMTLSGQIYRENGIDESFCLVKIPDFNSLIALSQEHSTPVYALTQQQLQQTGQVLENNQNKQAEFRQTFEELADKIIGLTSSVYAVSA
ncbi:AAA family ATPase [Leptolyngbya cf. ectocarpi LEGE 11479]|uniref:AAA family ATPase n=1 Tax=Leptolyngbya cf. ectocarpi LEGE 11479 TaxID=1828722 RepID=A0A928ZTG7_LEPEC|nr:AAA family ATPase [Leptolyngbya ectocarpi]MBE9065384.1 AAA family ATPase [Leptolyngbya cf. ectocarpi LEGE 11479]